MADGASEDWGWKVDLRSWVRWLLYDTIFGWLQERWKKLSMGELIAGAVALFAYARNHTQLLLLALGAIAVLGLQLIDIVLRKILDKPMNPTVAKIDQPETPDVEDAANPRDEINFNYLPASPMALGWKQGYQKHPVPSDAIWKMGVGGSLVMELSDTFCAIDYRIGKRGLLSKRFVCDLRISNTSLFFMLVKLVTLDGTITREGYIKFEMEGGKPYPQKEYAEWVLPLDPPSLGDGWFHLDISLVDSVNKTWGQEGWILKELLGVRLRGHLSVSPIRFY